MRNNYRGNFPSQISYQNAAPLTNQVPYLSNVPGAAQDERFGFLPFVGGLALGGLLFNGGGGRPCCGGGYNYPVYQPVYQQPVYQQPIYQPTYSPQPTYPVYQQQASQTGYYGPYNPVMPTETTILESNKYYLS